MSRLAAVVVAVTVLPAWWFLGDVPGGTLAIVVPLVVAATVAGVVAVLAVGHGRPVLAAGALVVTAVAPTYFLYGGNLLCLALALWLVVARRRLV